MQACLERIETYNPKLNAFIAVMKAEAIASARQMDAEQAGGRLRGPLHGIPFAVKDNIDTAGIRTTAASALFDDRVPERDAEVTARLKNAGAVSLLRSIETIETIVAANRRSSNRRRSQDAT